MDVVAVVFVIINAAVVSVAMNAVVVVDTHSVVVRPLTMFLFCVLSCQRDIGERMITHHTRPIYDDFGRREDAAGVCWCFGLL